MDVHDVWGKLVKKWVTMNACIESDVFTHRLDPNDLEELGLRLVDPITGVPLELAAQREILESIWKAGEASDGRQVSYG